MTASPVVTSFHDEATGSLQYVIHDPATLDGVVIDPVLDFDPAEARVTTANADRILDHVRAEGLRIGWVLDTHPHADHFSAAHYLGRALGARRGIGARVIEVQALWRGLYNLPDAFPAGGRDWDRLFRDGDEIALGNLTLRVLATPGHTLASVSYVAGDAAFVADTFMRPDAGTARADFPGGSASVLYDSLGRLLSLPDETRIFIGHDYPEEGAAVQPMATVAEQRRNVHLDGATREDFLKTRQARDATLSLPDRMLAALQVNLRGGRLPEPEDDGRSYLKIPLNRF
ncbi:beta-lactamase-like protein [Rhodovulum sulfidophilum]|uniref:Beta-lactamase-like protein n=1 Tax=Rhodovulum sulfidophilum TaxID=35806 RepID=A0A0D6B8X6_RHOSU|nr:beta-lactamase-like protein [Rhodovulum sulfidophilum]